MTAAAVVAAGARVAVQSAFGVYSVATPGTRLAEFVSGFLIVLAANLLGMGFLVSRQRVRQQVHEAALGSLQQRLVFEGAIPGDTAATFNGKRDYGSAARQISDDFAIEFWFGATQESVPSSEQGAGKQWWRSSGLVDAEVNGPALDFGVSLWRGQVVAGVGRSAPIDFSIVSPKRQPGSYADGAWHHVVFTRKVTGEIELYVDGTSVGAKTGTAGPLAAAQVRNFGRIQTDKNNFAGSLDEIAVYNTTLTAATVKAHFDARVPAP